MYAVLFAGEDPVPVICSVHRTLNGAENAMKKLFLNYTGYASLEEYNADPYTEFPVEEDALTFCWSDGNDYNYWTIQEVADPED